jgi:hypothetical protein
MPARKKTQYYRAREGFAFHDSEGAFIVVNEGEIVRAGHSILKDRDDQFEPVVSFGRFDVEQATASPGEKRGE